MALKCRSLNSIDLDDKKNHSSFKTIKKPKTKQKKSKASMTSKKISNELKIQIEDDSEDEDPFVDSNLPYHGFAYTGGCYEYRRTNHLLARRGNNGYYNRTQCLNIIPFLYDQPEGMPCFIKKLDDVVNMSKEHVLIFLRGYGEPTDDADLNELRRRLAIAVGVPMQIANKKFHFDYDSLESVDKVDDDARDPLLAFKH